MDIALRPGSEPIAGYTLVDRLGRGGFGEVWKANGPGGFQVALKFVSLVDKVGPVELRALEVIKGIRHPHLLGTFGSWRVGDRLVIAMELADRTLLDRFREAAGRGSPGIPAPEIFEHFLDAAKALDYMNEPRHPSGVGGPQGIQHRDVKPQNLLLVGGSVKVADFGLARALEHSSTGHTGSLTLSYAAPEFFDQRTSSQSDQYSLAATYCHLRGGRPPFEGNPAAVMAGHVMRPPDLSMIPESERAAVARALAKAPRDRWASCRAFVEAVIASSDDEGEARRDPRTVAPTPKVVEIDDSPSAPASSLPMASAGSWPLYLLVGALSIVAAGMLLWSFRVFRASEVVAGPEAPGTTREKTEGVRILVDRGLAFLSAGDPDGAIREFNEVVRLDPGHATALAGRGFAHSLRNDPLRGFVDVEEAIRLDPKSAIGHSGLALSLRLGPDPDLDRAVINADRAVHLAPDSALAYAVRCVVSGNRYWFRKNEADLACALADGEKAVALDPRSAFAHFARGHSRNHRMEPDVAIPDFNEAIRLNPRFALAFAHRSTAWHRKNEEKKAIDDADEAIRLDPKLSIGYFARANAREALGDGGQAEADRREAQRLIDEIKR